MKNKYTPFFIILLMFAYANLQAQIERVEPPFWWSGMQKSELQLMIYGENIASFQPKTDEIAILEVKKTENPNYLFVTIDTKNVVAQKFNIDFEKNGKVAFSEEYELKERKQNSAQRKGFDSSDMIYLLMPDRFANGNTKNDSQPNVVEKADRTKQGGRHGGDIEGIIEHLDYIESLGATAIWSTPLCEDNDTVYSYHTYAQSDVYKIDPRYGTNEDYKKLASELHQRNMKLIMDYVVNHWGTTHWMMDDLPTYDWIHQFPGYAQTNYRMSTQMDPNASEIDAKMCMDGWFVKSMPDLNQSNPLALNYLIQNAIWWIEYADLDGFRVDTYSYNDKKGIATWTKAVMDEYPNFNIVGEIWLHDQAQIAYWQKDSKIGAIQNYNTYLPSVMDFTLHDAVSSAFYVENPSWDKGMIQVYENFVNDFLYPDINNILVFAENHDTGRVNEIYNDIQDYKLIMTLLATVRGIPQLYYGSEVGMKGNKGKGDGDIRRDFLGGWKEDAQSAFVASDRTGLQNEYFNFTSKIFNWRKKATAIHNGKTTQYLPQDNVYVYFRYNDNQKVMVVINNSKENRTLDLNRFKENLKEAKTGKEIIGGEEISLEKPLNIVGKTSYIIEVL
ncbi:glycoside hydrolase family 13 protein [Galbibacter pacificus]|uniref:Glycoside hydrolase family 13 protein n=1 Tax=Galbibacter pacificus TaxID=2996052 RepID=A0ABT6FWE0_9FLAO|nr:glycoside hydrolase family 13 protein [Galbibacter pacificus]MDG3584001.1 glycoside hydrolase family 13 protein [Galbibacter pacificus]MDG3587562.1 glycoside hydrolase family 13 protein [Galbibacter pacificus]